jgi:hypothetical protein
MVKATTAKPGMPDLDSAIGYTGAFPLMSLGGVSNCGEDLGQWKAELGIGRPAMIKPPPATSSPTGDSVARLA